MLQHETSTVLRSIAASDSRRRLAIAAIVFLQQRDSQRRVQHTIRDEHVERVLVRHDVADLVADVPRTCIREQRTKVCRDVLRKSASQRGIA